MEFGFNSSSPSGGGGLIYMGAWDALTNSPLLQSGVGNNGEYYIVNVAGSTNLDGITDWEIGDWAVFNGSAWQKIDNSSIGGSGTTNYISKFTGSATLGDSQIFDNGTNVGIGTNNPQYKLDVKGNVLLDGTNTGSYFNFGTPEETFIRAGKTGSKVYINNSHNGNVDIATGGGNVGIGTAATSDKLTVNGSGYFFGELTVNNYAVNLLGTNTGSYFNFGTNQNVYIRGGKTNSDIYLQDNHNGLVGVGTTSPTAKLQVQGIDSTSSNFSLKVDNSSNSNLFSLANDGLSILGFTGGSARTIVNLGDGQVFRINADNNANFEISDNNTTWFKIYPTAFNEATLISNGVLDIRAGGASTLYMRFNESAAGVGINTQNPTARLHVQGIDATSSNFALKIDNSTPTTLFSVRNDGVIDVYGTITPRIQSVVSAATVTPTNLNDEVIITAQAAALFLANPTGTAVQGQSMLIRIKDNGTARAITYDTQYRAIGVTLPTTTVINKTIYLGLVYNLTDTKWDVVGVSIEGADPLYDSGWIDYSATSTIVGWSSFTTKIIRYRIIGKQMFVSFSLVGTSNSTVATFTLPQQNKNNEQLAYILAVDNGAARSNSYVLVGVNSSTVILYEQFSSAWTNVATKSATGQFFIEIA